ncbi:MULTISPECIES: glycosyltransferase [Pseudomonas]|uniref:glycosyltransferase n=1 Tax=Pseudomonas TaxID=286 RepID=UPI0030032AA7
MSEKYKFSYEPISVYACAVDLIKLYSAPGSIHIDLGCGYAAIAGALVDSGIKYIGFDANLDSVNQLTANGIDAYCLDLNDLDELLLKVESLCANYKTITISMLDVIEHLDYECQILTRLKTAFSSDQQYHLILSVPNTSHTDVAVKLLSGEFTYLDTGLLDKTHTVIYTEHNLSEVVKRNGWSQVAIKDYRLEFSEQFQFGESIVLNRDTGIGHDLRQLKGLLDSNADVYQFVRAYKPTFQQAFDTNHLALSDKLKLGLYFIKDADCDAIQKFSEIIHSSDFKDQIFLYVHESDLRRFHDSPFSNFRTYNDCLDGAVIGDFTEADYYLFVNDPAHVCLDSLSSFLSDYQFVRGRELIVIADESYISCLSNQFESIIALRHINSWQIIIPKLFLAKYSGPVIYLPNHRAWIDFIIEAGLFCGVKNSHYLRQSTYNVSPLIEYDIEYKYLISKHEFSRYIFRSGVWSDLTSDVFESLLSRNVTLLESLADLEAGVDSLRNNLSQADSDYRNLINSHSWRLTKPLRFLRRLAGQFSCMIARDFSADKFTFKYFVRRCYSKVPGLRYLWNYYSRLRINVSSALKGNSFSKNNSRALANLTKSRFESDNALQFGEVICGQLPVLDISAVSFNSSRWVEPFIKSLISQDYPLSKIAFTLVDHGSTDDTLSKFHQFIAPHSNKFFKVNFIQQPNLGFGAGHDRAIRSGSSDYCLIVNLDLEFSRSAISTVVSVALDDLASGSNFASWEFRQTPYEHPKYYDPVTLETNWSSHACILISRLAYEKCGGYDDAIFMYGEDVEFSYRLRSYGYRLKYVPSAQVLHHTYDHEGEVKPLQYTGSVLGNAFIRLRYGSFIDRLYAYGLYGVLFFIPSPFKGAKQALLSNARKLLTLTPHFLKGKGPVDAAFPLRGFDYEMIKEGAFWPVAIIDSQRDYPLVTIITRTYKGRGTLLGQSMSSVFNQTYPNIELIVAEDGGDTQKNYVMQRSLAAPKNVNVRFIANEKIGRSGVGNAALKASTGSYIMFLDDDDLLFADHVETLMHCLLSDNNFDAAYSLAFEVLTSMDADKMYYLESSIHTPSSFFQEWDYQKLLLSNYIPIQSIIFSRKLYELWGGFDLELDQLEDWNLWLRYGYKANFKFVPKTTSLFRTPSDMETRLKRHAELHGAYNSALDKAVSATKEFGGFTIGVP